MHDYRELLYASYRTGHYEAINPGGLSQSHIEDFRSELAGLLPLDRKARVVDLGCGKGFLVQFLLREGYENVLGVDTSGDQVEFGKNLGLPVLQADALEFLRHNKNLDLVICTDLIEHFGKDELVELLRAIHDALAPGGAVIIRTINCSSVLGSTWRYIDFTHETGFTERSLRQVLTACGFERILITDSKAAFRWRPKRLVRWSLFKLWRIVLRIILALEAGGASPRLLGASLIAKAFKHSESEPREGAAGAPPCR
jgi:2-polyprenyl-3-methyl-5-hydroxy-6-metoxy-1,4-benzoquinol methylase